MTLSMAAFTINDVFMVLLSDEWPLFQAISIRCWLAAVFLVLIGVGTGGLRLYVPRGQRLALFVRSLAEAAAAIAFLGAIFHMDFANANAIGQIAPLVVSLAAWFWLKERLTPVRIAMIAVGFIGALLIVQPGREEFNWWSLSVILCVLAVTCRDIITRKMSADIPALTISLYGAVSVALCAGFAAFFQGFAPITLRPSLEVFCSSSFLVVGYFTAIWAMRVGEVSFVAPYRYTNMVFALILNIFVLAKWPEFWTLVGAAVVIGAGLVNLWADRPRRELVTQA